MKRGLLWFDQSPDKTLPQKVAQAAARYAQKFKEIPNTCYVHPETPVNESEQVGPVTVKPLKTVLRHHFWIGIEERRPSCQTQLALPL